MIDTRRFEGYLLVTDMDGTLLGADKRISAENKAAIERFVHQGGKFTLATGRIASSAKRYAQQLPVGVPAILYNGAMIYDYGTERTVWERTLPETAAEVMGRVLERYPEIGVEIYTGAWEVPFFLSENAVTERHYAIEGFQRKPEQPPATPWHKILFAWEPERLDAILPSLPELTGDAAVEWIRSDNKYLELLPQGATKGHALEELVRVLGFDMSKCIAMGDHLNDLEMLRRAGIGVAVANAHPELLGAAARHGKHHDEHAVADVIEWLEQEIKA